MSYYNRTGHNRLSKGEKQEYRVASGADGCWVAHCPDEDCDFFARATHVEVNQAGVVHAVRVHESIEHGRPYPAEGVPA